MINEYISNENIKEENKVDLTVETQHVDGSFNADRRTNSLNWLKSDTEKIHAEYYLMSNAFQSVDVPSLDAIMFLHQKKPNRCCPAVGRVRERQKEKILVM